MLQWRSWTIDLVSIPSTVSTYLRNMRRKIVFETQKIIYLQKQSTIVAFICNSCAHMERISEMHSKGTASEQVNSQINY